MKSRWTKFLQRQYLGIRGTTVLIASSPLWVAVMIALFQGRWNKVGLCAGALACFYSGGRKTRWYFLQQRELLLHGDPNTAIRDPREKALLRVSAGILLLSIFVLKRPSAILTTTLLGTLGYYLNYMIDSRTTARPWAQESGFEGLTPTLKQMLHDAQACILALEKTAAALSRHPEELPLAGKIRIIAEQARHIVRMMRDEPDRIRAARTFFVVHLPGLQHICTAYLARQNPASHNAQCKNLMKLLETAETAFSRESMAIDERQERQLQVQMDVLRRQLDVNDQNAND